MIDILVILDRSGSMQSGKADHEGGLRSFVEDQQGLPGDVRFTMTQFDDANPCEIVYDRVPIVDVKEIHLVPRGGTPLYDGIGMALTHLAGRVSADPSDQRIVMVITDGQDTGDTEWTKAMVKSRIVELEKDGWNFLFLGANMDSATEAGALGMNAQAASSFNNSTVGSVGAMYGTISNKIGATRMMRSSGVGIHASSRSLRFYDEDTSAMANGSFVATGLTAIQDEINKANAANLNTVDDGHANINTADDGHSVTVSTGVKEK